MPNSVPPLPLHVPPCWADAATWILKEDIRRAIVIGAVDAGKSTLCRFLFDHAPRTGRTAALLDTDVGQKTVGPPASVTLLESGGMRLSFVGTTDPVRGWTRLVEGTHRLANATSADLTIINTSGLLTGPGRKLKAAKIEAAKPELLIAVGSGPDLEAVLRDHPDIPCLRLACSPEARRKTDGERRAARREAFRQYFAGATVRDLRAEDLRPMERNCHASNRLLVGLADEPGRHLGLGIVCEATRATMRVMTPVAEGRIRRIVPGSIRLDDHFSDAPVRRSPESKDPPA